MSTSAAKDEEEWRKILIDGHRALVRMRWIFRHLPSEPRCKVCSNPFGGVGGRLGRYVGYSPSRKNPNLCSRCCDALPEGGAEVDIAVLFADVRASTQLGERVDSRSFAAEMNQFYRGASQVLLAHDALIDKLIGDEVMALFIPGVAGAAYRQRAVEAARALNARFPARGESGIQIGVAVHAGPAFVGNVGSEGVVDFTALGDTVNTASRLQAAAAPGEVVVSDSLWQTLPEPHPVAEHRSLELRGKGGMVEAWVLSADGAS